jgi:periplasmic protein CpxP/Spy
MLKRCLFVLTVTCLFCAMSSMVIAQDNGANNQQSTPGGPEGRPGHGSGRGPMDPSKRAAMIGKRLNLSPDQQSKVEEILKSEQSQMQTLRADSSASQEDRHSKMMDIHKSSNDQIRALLNDDQQKKWDEMQTKQQEWMQGHHHGGQGPGASSESAPPTQQPQ